MFKFIKYDYFHILFYITQLPVITNLRNPSLKQRHWDTIENILEYTFTKEEPLTLGLLTNLDAFAHTEAIEEVAGQASSESALETLLKKVRFEPCH